MINIPINIQLQKLWGAKAFAKNDWGTINLIVGPNGTGKSLFADQLKAQLVQKQFKVRLLNAERLAGLEKQDYQYFSGGNFGQGFNISQFGQLKSQGDNFGLSSSAFVTLKERLDIRIRIEALLSDIFNKTIRLVEEGGYLKPKIQNVIGGDEYALKEQECHGLKELLTLLTFLYDETKNCLILDEPELHLHPQFQAFFLSEIRKVAGDPRVDPKKKVFFIITHSPYFLELRELDDLKNVLVSHYNVPPTFVDTLDTQDEYVLKRFLPRFNTHHKQFFFSPNPVFVEGYTDQQVITILFDKLDYNVSAAGSCIVDVGGKDELAVFLRLCKKLNVNARIIADLDALFKGKLREIFQQENRCNKFVQEKGLGTDVSILIGELDRKLKEIADDLVQKTSTDADVIQLIEFLKPIIGIGDKRIVVITSIVLALDRHADKVLATISDSQKANANFILPRLELILQSLEEAGVYILSKGEIEHYYTQSTINYLAVESKDNFFHTERDYLLGASKGEIESKYSGLIQTLKKSVPIMKIDFSKHLKYQIVEWIQSVQRAISKGDISDLAMLKANAKIDYALFSQIIEVVELNIGQDKRFTCKIKISNSLSPADKVIDFTEKTIPHEFEFQI